MRRTNFLLLRVISSVAIAVFSRSSPGEIDFNRDVRPILSDACFACHGPDSGHREADLRLDLQEGLFRSVDSVTIVNPKSPDHSELLSRILSTDPDVQMPPPSSARSLSAEEKRTIRQWIQEGATWKGHWAYIAPQRPAVPSGAELQNTKMVDYFVNRELVRQSLQPLPKADAVTRLRRLSFDLTGLPPHPDIVAAFAQEPSPAAWQNLISELLSSMDYAERMTAFWLDQVRYADTNGIHGDNHREVWMYRDWVIKAFKRNMPFDQFTVEQLAGDLLPEATDDQKIASGYNRLLMTTREGGAQAKEYLAKYSADRVRNASTVWMGATIGCCECHDHKFDPYSINDFYQFAAFFADIQDVAVGTQPAVKMPSRQQQKIMTSLTSRLNDLQLQVDTQTPELDAAMSAWAMERQAAAKAAPKVWRFADLTDMKSTAGQTLQLLDDGSIMTGGDQPTYDTYQVSMKLAAGKLTAVRLETLRDQSFARKSLSRSPANGNFVLSGFRLRLIREADNEEVDVEVGDAVATYEQKGWPVAGALDGKTDTGWAIDGHNGELRDPVAIFRLKSELAVAAGDRLIVELLHEAVNLHNIGRFRLSTSSADKPGLDTNAIGVPVEYVRTIEQWPEVDAAARGKLAAYFRSISPVLEQVRVQHAETKTAIDELQKLIPETLITRTRAPREIKVLARGNWMDDSGETVLPAVPHFMTPIDSAARATRLDLAQWFVDADNPLVARVFVNRLWKLFFGQGIVKSADDFGSQGSWPSHPELLDWLAVEFRESGWDIQYIIRLIVSSEAYQRSSATTNELREADPFNKWLARQARFRLDAEFIRDNALAVSGLLVKEVGGPSVKPYQPEGYWAHLNFPKREWTADHGDDQYRRGLYTYWCRTFLHPSMRSFDAPSREECTVDRPRSNNSLQALVLLNDPSYVEAARSLATRVLNEAGSSTEERFDFIYQLCLSRSPRAEELAVLSDLLLAQQKQFAAAPAKADEFLRVGQTAPEEGLDKLDLAAWTAVARVVLNLHEVITRT